MFVCCICVCASISGIPDGVSVASDNVLMNLLSAIQVADAFFELFFSIIFFKII